MKIRSKVKVRLFILFTLLAISWLPGQVFEYRTEESAAISWNGISLHDARLLATGGVSLMVSGPFSAVENPAFRSAIEGLYDFVGEMNADCDMAYDWVCEQADIYTFAADKWAWDMFYHVWEQSAVDGGHEQIGG